VAIASGGTQHLGGDYLENYRAEGGVEVGRDQAVEGDIIQLNGSNGRLYYEGMHTAVVISHAMGSDAFEVVDSNWEWHETVREHTWNPYVTAHAHGLSVHIWRMGSASSPPGTGEMPLIPASSTAPEGTRFVEQGSGNQYLSVLSAALPISYADAQALDAERNTVVATVATGYLARHPNTLPAGIRVRPDGQLNQYIFDGMALHYVDVTVTRCLDNDHIALHTVPTGWSGKFTVSATPAPCGLPDETRFTEQGSLNQYLSVLGAALPMSYGDAQALDADGNTAVATVPVGYVAGVPNTLPAGTWIRPDGQLNQYIFDGSSIHYVDVGTSECLRNKGRILYTVPIMWSGSFAVSSTPGNCQ
jgi:hypothetical protein